MILAMIWKEWREQRSIALTVLAFGVLALTLTAQFVESTRAATFVDSAGARELMAPALVYLAGIVCGAVLLADEKEVGTFEFLDSLPCRRLSLWAGKAIFGVGWTCAQCAIFAGLAISLDCVPPNVSPLAYGVVLTFIGLLAFGWGIFGGALSRSTLGAVFQGAITSFAVGFILAVPAAMILGSRTRGLQFLLVSSGYLVTWVGAGLLASVAIFTTLDRQRSPRRRAAGFERAARAVPERRRRSGLLALVWLARRQAVFVMAGAFTAGIVVGGVMLVSPEAYPFLIWPGATVAIGVLAGVTTMGEEQTRGIARFWAERRLPLGRMWLTKTGYHFGIAAVAAVLMLILVYAGAPDDPFHSLLFTRATGIRAELFRFTWMGLVYGFVTGHLAGMVFRKTVDAGLVAAVTAATLVGVLAPSVLCGGAAAWQVWGPALVLLITSRLLLYPWATERVKSTGPALRVCAGSGLAALLIAGGILYRVLEIPNVSDRLAESGFEARLPQHEGNDPVRAAVLQYRRAADDARGHYQGAAAARLAAVPPTDPGVARLGVVQSSDEMDFLERAARMGSPEDAMSIKPWLDQVFTDSWSKSLEALAQKPIGVFEDPRDIDYSAPDDDPASFREMMLAVRARGAERQSEGDAAAYARLVPGALAACRSARNLSGWRTPAVALYGEEIILEGVGDWIANLDGHSELLRPLLAALTRHEQKMPVGPEDAFWADRVILRNTLQRLGTWLPPLLDPKATKGTPPSPKADAEAEVIGIAWNVPWERIRRERILRVFSHAEMRVDPRWLSGIHLRNRWRTNRGDRLVDLDRRGLTLRRAVRLQVAVRLYQLEHRESLRDLSQLVPEYLPAVPTDPYSDRPFRYRLSDAEVLEVGGIGRSNQLSFQESMFGEIAGALAHPDGWPAAADKLVELSIVLRQGRGPGAMPMTAVGMGMNAGTMSAPPPPKKVQVAEESGILWSVGPDGKDDGGHRTPRRGAVPVAGQDWVFIVPPPQAARPAGQP